jgi:hypothetical protein
MTIEKKTAAFGGFTLAQIEAKMALVKTAFDAAGLFRDVHINAKWGLVRKAWLAGCKCPVTDAEMGAYAWAVAAFAESVEGNEDLTEMMLSEVKSFRDMVRTYYCQAVPVLFGGTDETAKDPGEKQETVVEKPAAEGQSEAKPPVDLPNPEELGPMTPLGGRAKGEPEPSGAAPQPARQPDVGGAGSTGESVSVG